MQQNAEVLSGIMISELANPGAPVLYGTVSAALDMRIGATALGGPEVGGASVDPDQSFVPMYRAFSFRYLLMSHWTNTMSVFLA